MKEVLFSAGAYAQIETIKEKGVATKVSLVNSFVCPKCEDIKLVAQKPELLK